MGAAADAGAVADAGAAGTAVEPGTDDHPSDRAPRPHGPRAEAREHAILDAAVELLKEVGYDRLSMDALAERAHAGKATIYRRWTGKAQVVAEAMRCMTCDQLGPARDTGDLRTDLLAELGQVLAAMSDTDVAIVAGVMSAMRADPELAELVRTQILDTKRGRMEAVVARAVARGELAPGARADLVEEVLPALLLNRLLFEAAPVDDAFAAHLVDDVLLPLLRQTHPTTQENP